MPLPFPGRGSCSHLRRTHVPKLPFLIFSLFFFWGSKGNRVWFPKRLLGVGREEQGDPNPAALGLQGSARPRQHGWGGEMHRAGAQLDLLLIESVTESTAVLL